MSHEVATQNRYTKFRQDEALAFELNAGISDGQPRYKYTRFEDSPRHHQDIALLWVKGRSVDQIAALYRNTYKNPAPHIRNVLRHPPIATYIAQRMEEVREAREAKIQQRLDSGDLGFDTIVEMVKDENTSAKVRGDLAKWLAEKDPLHRFTENVNENKDNVHDTESLTEFFDHHEQLKRVENEAIDVSSKNCDTADQQETENATDSETS